MSVEGDFDPEAIDQAREEAQSGSLKAKLKALYKFTRPHTIRGTILASIAGTIRALMDTPGALADANWNIMLPRAFIGMLALLMGNAFIVGINQVGFAFRDCASRTTDRIRVTLGPACDAMNLTTKFYIQYSRFLMKILIK